MQSNPELTNLLRARSTDYINHEPLPKQEAFLWLTCLDAFFGGAAGGGKSDALLMAALQYVDHEDYNAILLRENYPVLSLPGGLIDRSFDWLAGTDAKWYDKHKKWVFPSGATLSFGYLDGPRDHFRYQSSEFQFVGIDEAVNIRENQALYLFSRLRKLKSSPVPIRFRVASNPPAREQIEKGAWVKRRYVDTETREDRVFIPAWMDDNPYLDKEEYELSLENLDPITRQQLKDGNWLVRVQGNFFKREWFKLVSRDQVPPMDDCIKVRFWDRASTEVAPGKDPAYTAGLKMVYHPETGKYYIWNVHRFRESSATNEALIRQTADLDGKDTLIGIELEPGSSGKDSVSHYQRNILPEFAVKPVSASGSKTVRAAPFASAAERGDVVLVNGAWVNDFLDEVELFPDGQYKDQVDAGSGAYNILAMDKGYAGIRTL